MTGSLRLRLKTGNGLIGSLRLHLKTGKGLTGFGYGVTKIRKSFDRFASRALQVRKRFDRFVLRVLKIRSGLTLPFKNLYKLLKYLIPCLGWEPNSELLSIIGLGLILP